MGAPVVKFMGDRQLVISTLNIGEDTDGFDLDGDGTPDNKLSAVGSLARSAIEDAFATFTIVIPMEFFDFAQNVPDDCVKFAFYLGQYQLDTDGDGEKTADEGGDCNDHDAAIPGAAEIAGNGKDDDCNGLADETRQQVTTDAGVEDVVVPSTDTSDADSDGVTLADGDCDDTSAAVTGPTAAEICGDGLDNDCDGNADFGLNATNDPECTPYDGTPDALPLDPLSFNADGTPVIVFNSGVTTTGCDGTCTGTCTGACTEACDTMVAGRCAGSCPGACVGSCSGSCTGPTVTLLKAGPSLFSVNVPVTDGINLDLRITGATIEGIIDTDPNGIVLRNGRLGGVLDARTLDTIRGLEVSDINLTAEDSLLDAIFANILGTILGLQSDNEAGVPPDAWDQFGPRPATCPAGKCCTPNPSNDDEFTEPTGGKCKLGCKTPDIDVDRDGLESFCDIFPDDEKSTINVCIDGNGDVSYDTVNTAGEVTAHCTEAQKGDGTPLFLDGISIELNFEAVPALLQQ